MNKLPQAKPPGRRSLQSQSTYLLPTYLLPQFTFKTKHSPSLTLHVPPNTANIAWQGMACVCVSSLTQLITFPSSPPPAFLPNHNCQACMSLDWSGLFSHPQILTSLECEFPLFGFLLRPVESSERQRERGRERETLGLQ